jgi:hypothetical protein
VSTWAKSTARIAWACVVRNCRQVGPDRRGVGSRLAALRSSKWWRRRHGGRVGRAHRGRAGSPRWGSRGPSAAPGAPNGLWVGGRTPGLSLWVGPASRDEVGMPTQQGSRRDESQPAQRHGEQPAQRADDGAVDPAQRWAGGVDARRRPRGGAPGSRRPWQRRIGRVAPASSAHGRAADRRVGRPQPAIMLRGAWTVPARSAVREFPGQKP